VPGVQPPVIMLQSADHLTQDQQPGLPAANLPAVSDELKTGALVSIARGQPQIRLRPRPRCRLIPEQPHPYPPLGAGIGWMQVQAMLAQAWTFVVPVSQWAGSPCWLVAARVSLAED
jgi:hypothetical protein